jgi:hypothetical protein
MFKKLIGACMALAALAAFALPATASAANSPELCQDTPSPSTECHRLAVGTLIKATNVGETFLYETGGTEPVLKCTTATITGSITKNDGNNVEGKIETAIFGGTGGTQAGEPEPECTGAFDSGVTTKGLPWCIKSTSLMAEDEFLVGSGTCPTTGKVKFVLLRTKLFGGTEECEYESTGPLKGTGTTNTDEVHINKSNTGSGFTRVSGAFPCPSSGELKMTFTLETDTGPASDPITIK